VDTAKIEEFFEAYKEEGGDAVGVDGVIKLCEDLGVGEEDVVMLVIAWELKAQKMAAFSKDEWMSGFTRLGIEGLDKLKAELGGLRSKLEDDVAFKEVYGFAFGYYKEETQKSIAQETVRRNGCCWVLGCILPKSASNDRAGRRCRCGTCCSRGRASRSTTTG